MHDFLAELSLTEVSPEETRMILRRLAVEEFGGSEQSRIGDIAELSGASPEAIGRIPAEIRGQDEEAWKMQIEAKLDLQNRHIELLRQAEEKTEFTYGAPQHRIQFRKATKRDWIRPGQVLLAIAGIILLVYLFVAIVNR